MFTNNDTNVTKDRHIYIGGSDIPTILGINKFKTAYQLAREKAGIDPVEFKGNEYTEYGNILEPQIRDYINIVNETNFYPATEIDAERSIRGNCDGLDADYNLLLEIKTHGKNLDTRTFIPQMQLYMFLFNLSEGWLALYERASDFNVEFDSVRLKTRVIKRDEQQIQDILFAVDHFQKRVEWLKENPGASEDDFNAGTIMGGKDMNELQVKTIEFQPAVVQFNYDELEAALNENLKKYEGLTFTEDMAAECKKTIAELRKGKKAVDQYRLQMKKQLTAPVTEFENQCKALNEMFDRVLEPLIDQSTMFEDKRKKEKYDNVLVIVVEVIGHFELNQKHAAELVIEDSYLTKSKTLKSIREELVTLAEHLKMKQDKRSSDEEIIKSHVQLMNTQHDLQLIDTTYTNLLDYQEFQEVRERIDVDVEELLDQRLKEQQKAAVVPPSIAPVAPTVTLATDDESVYFEIYRVVGTESQLNALEEFMVQEDIEFTIMEELKEEAN